VPESLPTLERRHIIETLERVGWNRRRAAALLQISTTTLWRRLKSFGIEGRSDSSAFTQSSVS
jgi:DNA-binding NtrC family response regulator